jgi:hypothetical protein
MNKLNQKRVAGYRTQEDDEGFHWTFNPIPIAPAVLARIQ